MSIGLGAEDRLAGFPSAPEWDRPMGYQTDGVWYRLLSH